MPARTGRNSGDESREKAGADSQTIQAQPGLIDRLFAPVSIAPLVYFRIAFGAILVWSISMFFNYKDEYGTDLITRYFTQPMIHFKYYGFGWVESLSDSRMHALFFMLGVAALCIAAGFLQRLAAAAFCLGFTYVFLLEQSRYMNHYYLVCLVSLLMVFIPANRALSLDVLIRPAIRAATVPAWALWLLRFQFGVVYFYAGLAKCHRDWIDGTIMQLKLSRKIENPIVGSLAAHDWAPLFCSWGGLLLDLFIVPLLLWRKTRVPTLVVTLVFHLLNSQLFDIDIFPWMMIAATIILFFPDWLPWFREDRAAAGRTPAAAVERPLSVHCRITTVLLGTYVVVQLLVPLRHVFYSGAADWTEEGHPFAWRMLMREKYVVPPQFFVSYQKGEKVVQQAMPIPHPNEAWFWNSDFQFQIMAMNPDMILQFCHKYADLLRSQGAEQIDIRARVLISLNGREPQMLIDPNVNLANERRRWLTPYPWIMTFDPNTPRIEKHAEEAVEGVSGKSAPASLTKDKDRSKTRGIGSGGQTPSSASQR